MPRSPSVPTLPTLPSDVWCEIALRAPIHTLRGVVRLDWAHIAVVKLQRHARAQVRRRAAAVGRVHAVCRVVPISNPWHHLRRASVWRRIHEFALGFRYRAWTGVVVCTEPLLVYLPACDKLLTPQRVACETRPYDVNRCGKFIFRPSHMTLAQLGQRHDPFRLSRWLLATDTLSRLARRPATEIDFALVPEYLLQEMRMDLREEPMADEPMYSVLPNILLWHLELQAERGQ